jgi:L-threonylcarbamoyladenylate synthase
MTVQPFRSPDDVRAALPTILSHLDRGRLIAYPTETVYGFGSRPLEADVAMLARLKARPEGKPFLLLVNGVRMAERYGLVFTSQARSLAERYWPGPLTLVLSGGEGKLPDSLRGPEGGIAVRWTSHPGAAAVIGALGTPITSTSANRPGERTAPGAGAIVEQFRDAIDDGTLLVLDGGTLGNVPPSTLLDCTGSEPALIREGAIPRRELRLRPGRNVL